MGGILSSTQTGDSDSYDIEDAFVKSCTEKQNFHGTVSKLTSKHGIISDSIYFDVSLNDIVEIGDSVQGVAYRNNANEGWRAESLHIVKSDWDDEPDTCIALESETVSKVKVVNEFEGILENGLHFRLSDTNNSTYSEGDWVQYRAAADYAINIKPLRIIEKEAFIIHLNKHDGIIKGHIYFSKQLCGNIPLKVGQRVHVTAVESDYKGCKFRAVRVKAAQLYPDFDLTSGILFQDKNGINIQGNCDFGCRDIDSHVKTVLTVKNTSDVSVTLSPVKNVKNNFIFDNRCHSKQILYPGHSLSINIKYICSQVGITSEVIVFDFSSFKIARLFCVDVICPNEKGLTHYPYGSGNQRILHHYSNVVPGQKPKVSLLSTSYMKNYSIPKFIWDSVQSKSEKELVVHRNLDCHSYQTIFHRLLHIEEAVIAMCMRVYDQKNVKLMTHGDYITLDILGLKDMRPSLSIGDRVVVSHCSNCDPNKHYEGYIHFIMGFTLLMMFDPSFHALPSPHICSIAFYLNRTPFRRCHFAVDCAPSLGADVVFPEKRGLSAPQIAHLYELNSVTKGPFTDNWNNLDYFNKVLNERQRLAVWRVVRGLSKPLPHLILGPPGTGKTSTLVESVLQVYFTIFGSRLLVVTPSNSSADLLVMRLLIYCDSLKSDLIRLNSYQRSLDELPDSVSKVSAHGRDLPNAARKRIIISTCMSAGLLYGCQLPPDHFSHIFVDEAGQSTEPLTLIPLGLSSGSAGSCQVVLCGDPLQLGPVLHSTTASSGGLGVSLIDRLSQNPLYTKDIEYKDIGGYNPLLVTKLLCNYRSHPDILDLYSRLFYNGELTPELGDEVKRLEQWEHLPKKGHPVLFHGVITREFQEEDAPSWFNPGEVYQVVKYVSLLLKEGIEEVDIGVISPYNLQVKKTLMMLKSLGIEKVKVGSVEEFQGQEREVIILSTVRSVRNKLGAGRKLGFLSNWRRLNVGISRAKSLLIIIGNPHVLYLDNHWNALLKFIVQKQYYIGCELPEELCQLAGQNIQPHCD